MIKTVIAKRGDWQVVRYEYTNKTIKIRLERN